MKGGVMFSLARTFYYEVMSDRARAICTLAMQNFLIMMKELLKFAALLIGLVSLIALICEKPWSLVAIIPIAILIISFLNAGANVKRKIGEK